MFQIFNESFEKRNSFIKTDDVQNMNKYKSFNFFILRTIFAARTWARSSPSPAGSAGRCSCPGIAGADTSQKIIKPMSNS